MASTLITRLQASKILGRSVSSLSKMEALKFVAVRKRVGKSTVVMYPVAAVEKIAKMLPHRNPRLEKKLRLEIESKWGAFPQDPPKKRFA